MSDAPANRATPRLERASSDPAGDGVRPTGSGTVCTLGGHPSTTASTIAVRPSSEGEAIQPLWSYGELLVFGGGDGDDLMGDLSKPSIGALRDEHEPRQRFLGTAGLVVGDDRRRILHDHVERERVAEFLR